MSALFYSLIIMLTRLALNLALVVLGFEMVKSRPRRVSFRVLGYAVIGIGAAAAQGRPESLQIAGIAGIHRSRAKLNYFPSLLDLAAQLTPSVHR